MRPGDLVAGRFVLEAQAGTGGMGEVYRATDLQRGAAVAVKLLRAASGADAPRFLREARLLEGLEHPGIVRHVAHGALPSGGLAMEWLEGEDLSRRLGRGPLGVDESVEIARRSSTAISSRATCSWSGRAPATCGCSTSASPGPAGRA
ncbi:hypothetical protein BE20_11955 [Sorangium cellulosum]|nr:hypothetical protein BE20_11955 [Sorangium cellulosum]